MVRPLPDGGENEVSSIAAEKVYRSILKSVNILFNSQTVVDYYSMFAACIKMGL